jgi:sedoheptulose-bisphosphatase
MGEMQKCGGLEHEENGVPPVPGARRTEHGRSKKKKKFKIAAQRRPAVMFNLSMSSPSPAHAPFVTGIPIPAALAALLSPRARSAHLDRLLAHLLHACAATGRLLRSNAHDSRSAAVGSHNAFGDAQLAVDVKTDAIFFEALAASRVVHVAASEETPVETRMAAAGALAASEGFSVAFDPLDGSSIVDANFAVGSIVGVWPGAHLLGRTGREQCAALVAMYGPRVTVALAIAADWSADGCARSVELTWTQAPITSASTSAFVTALPQSTLSPAWHWELSRPRLHLGAKAKTFAPGNLRACADNAAYARTVSRWIESKMTLRYSGGLVPDVYHMLIKGEGYAACRFSHAPATIANPTHTTLTYSKPCALDCNSIMANASSPKARAKLRLAFEAAPIALIVECAGGASCAHIVAEPSSATSSSSTLAAASESESHSDSGRSLLDARLHSLDRRVGVCFGARAEVERFARDVCGATAGLQCPPLRIASAAADSSPPPRSKM